MMQPMEYASVGGRRGWTLKSALLLAGAVVAVLVVLAVALWGLLGPAPTLSGGVVLPTPTPAPVPIVLPQDPLSLTLRPNVFTSLPGRPVITPGQVAGPYLALWIDGGQTEVQVADNNSQALLTRQSLKVGDTLSFNYAGTTFYLTLDKLTDFKADDLSSFTLSTKRPITSPVATQP